MKISKESKSEYKINKLIGKGCFGYVFAVTEKKSGKKFAIKRIIKSSKKISREYELSKILQNEKNIVNLEKCFFSKNNKNKLIQNFVFEFCDENLEEILQKMKKKKIKLNYSKIKQIIFQLLKGLETMHSKGICHRDLKPENILVKNGIIKIADFGSGKILEKNENEKKTVKTKKNSEKENFLKENFDKERNSNPEKYYTVKKERNSEKKENLEINNTIKKQKNEKNSEKAEKSQNKKNSAKSQNEINNFRKNLENLENSQNSKYFSKSLKYSKPSPLLNSPYVVSRYYRAPELFFGITNYNEKIDIWAIGIIFYEFIFLKLPFKGKSEGEQLIEIFKKLSFPNITYKNYLKKNLKNFENFFEIFFNLENKKNNFWKIFDYLNIPEIEKKLVIRFLKQCWCYNVNERISAETALKLPLFSEMEFKRVNF